MLNLKKIAVTGGFCSGKTTVATLFKEAGAYCVNADVIGHNLLESDPFIKTKVEEICSSSNQEIETRNSKNLSFQPFNRKKIADIVFSHKNKLHQLESLLQPKIWNHIEELYNQIKSQTASYLCFVVEVPLLFEKTWDAWFDAILYVQASPLLSTQWLQQRDHISTREEAEQHWHKRSQYFLPEEEKKKKSTWVIHNTGGKDDIKKQIDPIIEQIKTLHF